MTSLIIDGIQEEHGHFAASRTNVDNQVEQLDSRQRRLEGEIYLPKERADVGFDFQPRSIHQKTRF
jgi:hypothetical protein